MPSPVGSTRLAVGSDRVRPMMVRPSARVARTRLTPVEPRTAKSMAVVRLAPSPRSRAMPVVARTRQAGRMVSVAVMPMVKPELAEEDLVLVDGDGGDEDPRADALHGATGVAGGDGEGVVTAGAGLGQDADVDGARGDGAGDLGVVAGLTADAVHDGVEDGGRRLVGGVVEVGESGEAAVVGDAAASPGGDGGEGGVGEVADAGPAGA